MLVGDHVGVTNVGYCKVAWNDNFSTPTV